MAEKVTDIRLGDRNRNQVRAYELNNYKRRNICFSELLTKASFQYLHYNMDKIQQGGIFVVAFIVCRVKMYCIELVL